MSVGRFDVEAIRPTDKKRNASNVGFQLLPAPPASLCHFWLSTPHYIFGSPLIETRFMKENWHGCLSLYSSGWNRVREVARRWYSSRSNPGFQPRYLRCQSPIHSRCYWIYGTTVTVWHSTRRRLRFYEELQIARRHINQQNRGHNRQVKYDAATI